MIAEAAEADEHARATNKKTPCDLASMGVAPIALMLAVLLVTVTVAVWLWRRVQALEADLAFAVSPPPRSDFVAAGVLEIMLVGQMFAGAKVSEMLVADDVKKARLAAHTVNVLPDWGSVRETPFVAGLAVDLLEQCAGWENTPAADCVSACRPRVHNRCLGPVIELCKFSIFREGVVAWATWDGLLRRDVDDATHTHHTKIQIHGTAAV